MDETTVITEYRGLVLELARALAQRYKLRRFMDDLVAYGNEGLLEAARRFDPARGTSFSTFAYYRVRGRMLDGCRSFGLVARRSQASLDAARATNEHMLDRLDADEGQLASSSQDLDQLASELDELVADAGAIYLAFEPDEEALDLADERPSPEDAVASRRTNAQVRACLAALEERHRVVLEMSFLQDRTLDDIAARFDCSRSWASRMRASAVVELRRALLREGVDS